MEQLIRGKFQWDPRAQVSGAVRQFSIQTLRSLVTFPGALHYLPQSALMTAFLVALLVPTRRQPCAESAGDDLSSPAGCSYGVMEKTESKYISLKRRPSSARAGAWNS